MKKLEDHEGFPCCNKGGSKCRSNNLIPFLDLCEYKIHLLLIGSLDLVLSSIFHYLIDFAYILGDDRTPTPFKHLRMLSGSFGLGKLGPCVIPLSPARDMVNLVIF